MKDYFFSKLEHPVEQLSVLVISLPDFVNLGMIETTVHNSSRFHRNHARHYVHNPLFLFCFVDFNLQTLVTKNRSSFILFHSYLRVDYDSISQAAVLEVLQGAEIV